MKVILSGSSGYIGSEVLQQCLENPSINQVIALSRKDLPAHSKLTTVILKDFGVYPDSVLDQLKGSDACIWSIGTYNGSLAVDVEYPLTFANAMVKILSDSNKPFHYVHLGGAFTEWDQEKTLWFMPNGRQRRGLAESNMCNFEKEHSSVWKSFIAKPAAVLPKKGLGMGTASWLVGSTYSIKINELAAAMIDMAIHGNDAQVILNAPLVSKGRSLLQKNE
eukprot:TRINITY_DN12880_c0_g1_i1.p1 TRINITY_DN12880_c0_g1~~TRINITY_DN12880_c0_g1_i1.p1  ORF type:complete len:221 (+),score=38.93 TRINITY_DN12880_c0_g1_i1:45-707(+)